MSLASAVARNAPAMQSQLSMGDPPLLVTMGRLERLLLGQASASDPWKAANDLRKQQEAASTAAAGAPPGGPADAAAAGGEAGEGDADVDMGDGGDDEREAGWVGRLTLSRLPALAWGAWGGIHLACQG